MTSPHLAYLCFEFTGIGSAVLLALAGLISIRPRRVRNALIWAMAGVAMVVAVNVAHAQAMSPLSEYLMNGGSNNVPNWIRCAEEGNVYVNAAHYRDSGWSPENAYPYTLPYLPMDADAPAFVKHAINQVYFDPHFANARGDWFGEQMQVRCLDPQGRYSRPAYKPLQ